MCACVRSLATRKKEDKHTILEKEAMQDHTKGRRRSRTRSRERLLSYSQYSLPAMYMDRVVIVAKEKEAWPELQEREEGEGVGKRRERAKTKKGEDSNREEHAREGHVPIGALWVLEVSAILVVVGAKFSDRDLMGWGERRGFA